MVRTCAAASSWYRTNMPKILLYCPLSPNPPGIQERTRQSIEALWWNYPMEIVYGRENKVKYPKWTEVNDNITHKYNQARQMTLDGGYDALFTVEADMLIPPIALERLSRIEADVAYGLYVSRHGKHPW